MATLRYSQIRAHPDGTISYIANKEKMISFHVHDVSNVLNYMGEPESAERVYSFARYCSTNPVLAGKMLELYRARYFESKNGSVQGLADDRNELLGLHFFLSYTEEDDPSEEMMNEITQALAEHPLLRDFPFFSANHFDKTHKHTHFYACQYSAEGKPRKMCMRAKDYNDLRKYVNRLCVEHGLSIIDLAALRRNDPAYSAWVDSVIAEGNVTVHPERKEHEGAKRQKVSTRQIYYKWLKDTEEFNLEQECLLTAKQLSQKRAKEIYFYGPKEPDKPQRYYPVSGQNKYYCVRKYDEFGRKRSWLELLIILIIIIYQNEKNYCNMHDLCLGTQLKAKVDHRAQAAYNCIRTARELNIERPADIPDRIANIGKQMNALKTEKSRHEHSIQAQEKIINAWEIYNQFHLIQNDLTDSDQMEAYRQAVRILAKNCVWTQDAYLKIFTRYQFELRKISDYEKRLPLLKRQYHDLKTIEAMANRPTYLIDEIYRYSQAVQTQSQQTSLEEKICSAQMNIPQNPPVSHRRKSRFPIGRDL